MQTDRESIEPAADSDVVVVGGGILGLGVARELIARRPGVTVTVLEKEPDVGRHQTGHNSGVVHAGIYYTPGSLKAQLCVEGSRLLYDYCDEKSIAVDRCGKVIVATGPAELDRLDELERRGRANEVPGLRRLSGDELREIEPHVAGVAGLHSPNTGIIDFHAVARAYADDVRAAGGTVVTGCEVTKADTRKGRVEISHSKGTIRARQAVFCAGLWSDRLARASGAPADPRIVPFRGAYLKLRPEKRDLVKSLIYPVPDPNLPFLGVHLTRHIDGEVLVGPTALLVGARDAYELSRISPRDLAQTLGWPGSWRMFAQWWRTGIAEMRNAASRKRFVAEAARYVPELKLEDVVAGPAGVRAQALGRDGRLVDDFVISETERVLHVRNAPSPAATSSLAIARMIADRADAAAADEFRSVQLAT